MPGTVSDAGKEAEKSRDPPKVPPVCREKQLTHE